VRHCLPLSVPQGEYIPMTDAKPLRYPWFPRTAEELRAKGGKQNLALARVLERLGPHYEHGPGVICPECLPGFGGRR